MEVQAISLSKDQIEALLGRKIEDKRGIPEAQAMDLREFFGHYKEAQSCRTEFLRGSIVKLHPRVGSQHSDAPCIVLDVFDPPREIIDGMRVFTAKYRVGHLTSQGDVCIHTVEPWMIVPLDDI